MNNDAFREGFIQKCATLGIHDEEIVLELYKVAMCGDPHGKTPIQNPDDKERVNKKEVGMYQDYQGPGKGTPMMDHNELRIEELPEEVDPDVVDNMKRMKKESKEQAPMCGTSLAEDYHIGIPAERARTLWKPAPRKGDKGKRAQRGNRPSPQGAGLGLPRG